MAKKYKVKITNDDGEEEEVEVPANVHRAIAGISRAEAEKLLEEREKTKPKEKGFFSWGDDDDDDDDDEKD